MAMHGDRKESPEEHARSESVKRGGKAERAEGGFSEGTHGRGPTPYMRNEHSSKPSGHSLAAHSAESGRGGSGRIGKGDDFKGHSEDVEHPQSHSAFEALGTSTDDE
jgi:hypothetical protein